jgi:hypothetical protein
MQPALRYGGLRGGQTGLESDMSNSTLDRERDTTVGRPSVPVAGAVAQGFDPSAEENYWRECYSSRPYVTAGSTFSEYRPAYRYGIDAHRRFEGRSFDDLEAELMRDWDRVKGTSSLTWETARHAARDSWQRVTDFLASATPGDSDSR